MFLQKGGVLGGVFHSSLYVRTEPKKSKKYIKLWKKGVKTPPFAKNTPHICLCKKTSHKVKIEKVLTKTDKNGYNINEK